MNYILFGGSGFIGTHLIHLLLKECVRPGDVIYDLDLVMPGEEGVVPGIVEKNDGDDHGKRCHASNSSHSVWRPFSANHAAINSSEPK